MPTYDYKCAHCGVRFEKFQSITAAPLRKCPECGKSALKRLVGTGAGIIFKGGGFYETDYRSDSYKKAAKAETGADGAGGDGGKSEKKADANPKADAPAKTETKPATPTKPAGDGTRT